MNILINGASGFIGYHLIKELLDNNHNVIAICRKISTPLESLMSNPHLNVIVCSQQELFSNICNLKVDVWFQLLWEGACGVLRSSPNVQINNELLAIMAMEVAHAINCKKIIYCILLFCKILKQYFYSLSSLISQCTSSIIFDFRLFSNSVL